MANNPEIPEEEKIHMTTLTECMNSLKEKGFHKEFKVVGNKLIEYETEKSYKADDVKIINFYRFEGESDPGDMEILYSLELSDGTKGTLAYVYGPLTSEENQAASNFMKQLRSQQDENPKNEQHPQ